MLASRSGLHQPVIDALAHAYERWDGKGLPEGLEGDAVPLAVRIVVVARDAELGVDLGARSGKAYDPAVVGAAARVGPRCSLASPRPTSEAALACEPAPAANVPADGLDPVLTAFADFADLKSPWIRGHSRRVAALAEQAGGHAGLDEERLRRAPAHGPRPRPRPRGRRERDLGQAGLTQHP